MNENQEAMAEDQQETVSFDFDDDNNVASSEDISASSEKSETRTIVRDSEDNADEGELENYSENVQKRINQLTAKRKQAIEEERLRIQKARSESAEAQQVQQQQVQDQQLRQQQQAQYDPKLVSWMGKNPWFGNSGDLVMTRGAQAIHEQLVSAEGFDPSSDDYYAEIDRRMRVEFPHKFQDKRRNAQAVTPASSGRSATKSGRKKTVELTPGQVAFAKKMKIPLERYAQEVAKLERKEA